MQHSVLGEAGRSLLPFVVAFVGINGLLEAVAGLIIGTAVSRALLTVRERIH